MKNLEILYKNGVIEKEILDKMRIEILNTQKNAQALKNEKDIATQTLSMLSATKIGENLLIPSLEEQSAFLQSVRHLAYEENTNALEFRPETLYFSLKSIEIESQKKLENAKNLPYVDLFFKVDMQIRG